MGVLQEEKEQIKSVPREQWDEVAQRVRLRPDYKSNFTRTNLPIVLGELGIDVGEITDETMRELLSDSRFSGVNANKLVALSRDDCTWFEQLQRTSEE